MHRDVLLTALLMAAAILCFGRRVTDKVIEALDNFRGGPPPTHPSPVNDAALLTKRRRKAEN
jgi:hypothetical protein